MQVYDNNLEKKRTIANTIIEMFEEFLENKGVEIPNEEKEDSDEASNIYGTDYYYLEDNITEILKPFVPEDLTKRVITITETLSKTVLVNKTDSLVNDIDVVKKLYEKGDIVLNDDDFSEVEYKDDTREYLGIFTIDEINKLLPIVGGDKNNG